MVMAADTISDQSAASQNVCVSVLIYKISRINFEVFYIFNIEKGEAAHFRLYIDIDLFWSFHLKKNLFQQL